MSLPDRSVCVITGPTSGIGLATALRLAKERALVLVGRDARQLESVQAQIARLGGEAINVVCDISDMVQVRRAADEIAGLGRPVSALINNAGISQMRPTKSAQGWDMSYATNHLGPFVLTEALLPLMPDGANVIFIASAVEDPERGPAKATGFKGARFLSVQASARGEWLPGGSALAGADAYATSKQSTLAAAYALAAENPRVFINAVEPGFTPGTSLGRDAGPVVQFLLKNLLTLIAPYLRYWSTPRRSAETIAEVLRNAGGQTGVYFDERGRPMLPSLQMRDPAFPARVAAETRAFLAAAGV